MEKTQQEILNKLTVSELRKVARSCKTLPDGVTGVGISGANKSQLIEWLASEKTSYPNPEPSEPTPEPTREGATIHTSKDGIVVSQPVANMPGIKQDVPGYIQTTVTGQDPWTQDLAKALAGFANAHPQPQPAPVMDEARIIELIKEHQPKAREVVVKQFEKPEINVGIQHKMFDQLLHLASQRIPAYLVGPTGSGKTHAAEQLAKALELPYEAVSVGPMTSKVDLVGYKDGTGQFHDTGLIRCFRDGGVFLLDEADAGNAGVLTIINMATSNGQMSTPVGMIPKHENFVMIVGANTFGLGADRQYVGRNQLDEATLNRFFFVDWGYDESIEMQIAGADDDASQALVSKIQEMRKHADENKMRVAISPRNSIYAVRLLKTGMPEDEIIKGLIFKGADESTISKLKGE